MTASFHLFIVPRLGGMCAREIENPSSLRHASLHALKSRKVVQRWSTDLICQTCSIESASKTSDGPENQVKEIAKADVLQLMHVGDMTFL
jgi:hypothetical protein